MTFVRVIKGKRYLYRCVRQEGKIVQLYLGRAEKAESKNAEDF